MGNQNCPLPHPQHCLSCVRQYLSDFIYIVLFNEVYMPLMLGRKQKLRHRNIMVNLFNKHLGTFGSILNIYHLDHIYRFQSVPSSGKKIQREY